eukprot:Sdes_comp23466_c0_seq1m21711
MVVEYQNSISGDPGFFRKLLINFGCVRGEKQNDDRHFSKSKKKKSLASCASGQNSANRSRASSVNSLLSSNPYYNSEFTVTTITHLNDTTWSDLIHSSSKSNNTTDVNSSRVPSFLNIYQEAVNNNINGTFKGDAFGGKRLLSRNSTETVNSVVISNHSNRRLSSYLNSAGGNHIIPRVINHHKDSADTGDGMLCDVETIDIMDPQDSLKAKPSKPIIDLQMPI